MSKSPVPLPIGFIEKLQKANPDDFIFENLEEIKISEVLYHFISPLLDLCNFTDEKLELPYKLGLHLWNSIEYSPQFYSDLQKFVILSIKDQKTKKVLSEIIASRTGKYKDYSKLMIQLHFDHTETGMTTIVGSTDKLSLNETPHPALVPEDVCFSFIRSYLFKLELVDRDCFSIKRGISKGYSFPLNSLFELGSPDELPDDFLYQTLDFKSENIPELIQILSDNSLSKEIDDPLLGWVPMHAWRTLGELNAIEAIPALLHLLQRIDCQEGSEIQSEIPNILAQFGEAALEPTTRFLADSANGIWSRVFSIDVILKIAESHSSLSETCREILHHQFEKMAEQNVIVNTALMSGLIDFKSFNSLPLMEKGFEEGLLDTMLRGDWEDVQIDMGLLTKRLTPPKLNPFAKRIFEIKERFSKNISFDNSEDPLSGLFYHKAHDSSSTFLKANSMTRNQAKVGRNDPCPCGSEKKYKKCCLK